MPTTLISIIGKPRGGAYTPVTYQLHGQNYPTEFFFLPLLQHYRPDRFFLLGTRDSIWDKVEEARRSEGFEYERVEIPFGMNDAEVWQIFQTIVSLPLRETELILDITHGFRAIPIAVFLAALYFQAVREDVKVLDVLYGNLEAKDPQTGVAPVVHLQAYLDMNEWIGAANRFIHYGDGDLLYQKLFANFSNDPALQPFLNSLKNFTDNLQLNLVSQITPTAERLRTTLTKEAKKTLLSFSPYSLLHPFILQQLNSFVEKDSEWKQQWKVAKWFFANRQYTQSLIVLRETLLTFTCQLLNLPPANKDNREKKAGYLHTYLIHRHENDLLAKKYGLQRSQIEAIQYHLAGVEALISPRFYKQWAELVEQVQLARNQAGHALIQGRNKNDLVDPQYQIEKLHHWLELSKEIFEMLEAIAAERKELAAHLANVLEMIKGKAPRVFLLANEGVHPIIEDLKRQYGADIRYEVVTRGNIELDREAEIAKRVKEIVEAHHGAEFAVVPSGLPYIVTVVYNTLLQITSKHPLYLQLDREAGRYIEKTLDPRKLIL